MQGCLRFQSDKLFNELNAQMDEIVNTNYVDGTSLASTEQAKSIVWSVFLEMTSFLILQKGSGKKSGIMGFMPFR